MQEGYLNELSLPAPPGASARALFDTLLDATAASCFRVRSATGVLDQPAFNGKSVRVTIFTAFSAAADVDYLRRLADVLLQMPAFDIDVTHDRRFAGRPAYGLSAALLADGLAVSFATHADWERPHVEAHDAVGTRYPVRHVSRVEHVSEHQTWLNGSADARTKLRRQLYLLASHRSHILACEYGKHVRGSTNRMRQERAARPGGAAQFLVEQNNVSVDDSTIRAWEDALLDAVRDGADTHEIQVFEHGGAFHAYGNLGHDVGYEGGTGEPITWLRVELSGMTVHSHPRTPSGTTP